MVDAKTWESNPSDLYPLQLGQLLANITSLDMALRAVLYQQETPASARRPIAKPLTMLRAGDVLEESALTSWDSLGRLISKYNSRNPDAAIADGIVDLRDAFAHGRILTDNPVSHLRLIRFSHPRNGRVTVEMAEDLSPEWLAQQIRWVFAAVQTVHARLRAPDSPRA
jgi:hypothetical protein